MWPIGSAGKSVARSAAICLLAVACSASDADDTTASTATTVPSAPTATPASVPVSETDELDGLSARLVLTRQRDLLDRGLINVQLLNESDQIIEMTHRQLLADHFATEPAAPRTSAIPNGRPVNVQVPYGTADDCASPEPVQAQLDFTYTTADGDPAPRTASIAVEGTHLLDGIRAEQCAGERLAGVAEMTFGEPSVDGETVSVDLLISANADAPPIQVVSGWGTILVGAEVPAAPIEVAPGETVVPVVFDVNRCDPHAMAEVTKRYGLELQVSIDGQPPLPIDVDVAPILSDLETIVANCQTRAGTEL